MTNFKDLGGVGAVALGVLKGALDQIDLKRSGALLDREVVIINGALGPLLANGAS